MTTVNNIADTRAVGLASMPSSVSRNASVEQTAKDFESMFLSQMLQPMFDSVEKESLMGDPETDEVYQSWLVDQYAKLITDAGGVGVADHVKKELLALQEVKS